MWKSKITELFEVQMSALGPLPQPAKADAASAAHPLVLPAETCLRISDRGADRRGDPRHVVFGDAEIRRQPQPAPRYAAGIGKGVVAGEIRRLTVNREPEGANADASFLQCPAHGIPIDQQHVGPLAYLAGLRLVIGNYDPGQTVERGAIPGIAPACLRQ